MNKRLSNDSINVLFFGGCIASNKILDSMAYDTKEMYYPKL
jgi:hypothetical protein